MSELIPLAAIIGDRTYRIKVEAKDEAQVRQTLKTINDKIVELKSLYAGKDMQDYISMTLLWFATQPSPTTNNNLDSTTEQAGNDELKKGLQLLEQLIDAELKQR
ncbi:MAG: hypothetical protein RL463_1037 [Bacteroidota bacterium]